MCTLPLSPQRVAVYLLRLTDKYNRKRRKTASYLSVRQCTEGRPSLGGIDILNDSSESLRRKQQTTNCTVAVKQLTQLIRRSSRRQMFYQENHLASFTGRLQICTDDAKIWLTNSWINSSVEKKHNRKSTLERRDVVLKSAWRNIGRKWSYMKVRNTPEAPGNSHSLSRTNPRS